MSSNSLPPPEAVRDILIWHQGALGDLLLAGPALSAVSRHYPQARITALGHPERWGLLAGTLPLAAVWDSSEALWAHLFGDSPLPPQMETRLTFFPLALVFAPRPQPRLLASLCRAGIPAVHWIPSFSEGGREAVAAMQARHLAGLGVEQVVRPFRLEMRENHKKQLPELPGSGPWLALAPGSGQPMKNWPLPHYYELSRSLAWQYRFKVVWLTGPGEAAMLPYLQGLAAAQGHLVLQNLPLKRVAAVLSRARLYVGNDSGLTHLAAAAGAARVLALFGPTDPRVWAPWGAQVEVLAGPCVLAPCAVGREIPCPDPQCLKDLTQETVLAAAAKVLSGKKGTRPGE